MTEVTAADIIHVLEGDPIMVQLGSMIALCEELEISTSKFQQWEGQFKSDLISCEMFLRKVLDNWISSCGPSATLLTLTTALERLGLLNLKAKLCDRFDINSQIVHRRSHNADNEIPNTYQPIPDKNFVGRNKELAKLQSIFNTRNQTSVLIGGLGGIGKTELTKQFLQQLSSIEKPPFIAWISGDSFALLFEGITKLSNKFRIPLTGEQGKTLAFSEITEKVCNAIVKIHVRTGSVIVVDNLDEPIQELDDTIPIFLENNIFIIITSRNLNNCNYADLVIKLEELVDEDACSLLQKCLGTDEAKDDLMQLCKLLQNHPLALQQAAAFIKVQRIKSLKGNSYGISDYLVETDTNALSHPLRASKKKVATLFIWDVTFKKITEQNETLGKSSLEILSILSFLHPDVVMVPFLTRICLSLKLNAKESEIENALLLLKTYCLVNAEEHRISMHRLVQKVVQTKLKNEAWGNGSLNWGHLLDHLLIWLDISLCNRDDINSALNIWQIASQQNELLVAHWKFADCLFNRLMDLSMYEEAKVFSNSCLVKFSEIEGNESISTLVMRRNVGRSLEFEADYEGSHTIYKEVWEKMKQLFGNNDEETLNSGHLVASTLMNLNKLPEALDLGEEILKLKVLFLGLNDPSTLRTMHNIALTYNRMGFFDKAIEMYQEVLKGREQVLGANHQYTISTRSNIACCLYSCDKNLEAKLLLEIVVKERSQVLGPLHAETLMAKYMVALNLCKLKEYETALAIAEEVYLRRLEVLGEDHAHTKNTKTLIVRIEKKSCKIQTT